MFPTHVISEDIDDDAGFKDTSKFSDSCKIHDAPVNQANNCDNKRKVTQESNQEIDWTKQFYIPLSRSYLDTQRKVRIHDWLSPHEPSSQTEAEIRISQDVVKDYAIIFRRK